MSDLNEHELQSLDIAKILEFLPHRYPFLLVDRVTKIDRDISAVGIKNVTINEPFFQGHFPNNPVMPGVLIIGAMAQTAAVICVNNSEVKEGNSVLFLTVDRAKFRRPVIPGDRLELHVNRLKRRGNIWRYQCIGMVDGAKAAEAEISALMTPPDQT